MKIALIGYGKMGKMIEEIALERGHEVVLEMDCRPDQCESLKQAALTVVTEIVRRGASSRERAHRGALP